jgi:hypothetical protein
VNNKVLEGSGHDPRHNPAICPEGQRKIMKTSVRIASVPNYTPLEYKSSGIIATPTCSAEILV